jgi:putative ABC transport system ATP-binding protein
VALVGAPTLLLADEPTGELDTETAAAVFGALQAANSELGVTVLVVTHDPEVSGMVRRVIAIADGRTSTETLRSDSTDGGGPGHEVEYAVLDRSGRLQLPHEMTDALGMRDRVRLEAEPDHIGVWPDSPSALPATSPAPPATDAQPSPIEVADTASAPISGQADG